MCRNLGNDGYNNKLFQWHAHAYNQHHQSSFPETMDTRKSERFISRDPTTYNRFFGNFLFSSKHYHFSYLIRPIKKCGIANLV